MSETEFDPQEAAAFISIMLVRLYDVMLVQLRMTSAPIAEQVIEMHKNGETFCPAPVLSPDAFKND